MKIEKIIDDRTRYNITDDNGFKWNLLSSDIKQVEEFAKKEILNKYGSYDGKYIILKWENGAWENVKVVNLSAK